MSRYDLARVVVGVVLGLGLASLPFVQYGARTHAHAPRPAHDDAVRARHDQVQHAHD